MTAKDYRAIAQALNDLGHRTQNWQAVRLAAQAIAPVLAADNARFDEQKFIDAVYQGKD